MKADARAHDRKNRGRASRCALFGGGKIDYINKYMAQHTRTPLLSGGLSGEGEGDSQADGQVALLSKPKAATRRPAKYKVLMLNDDYTPMDFVVHILEKFFQKSRSEATTIMLQIHHTGLGVCGVFSYEIAETKVNQVMDYSRQQQHPLQCTLERE